MDTTYFWRKYGYMIFRIRDPVDETGKNILRYKVWYETNDKYKEWISFLQSKWFEIIGIVCDWRRWLLGWFWEIPTQMCIFHQQKVITKYITKNPKLEPNIELRDIAMHLGKLSLEWITMRLESRYIRNKNRLSEKNQNKKSVHERTLKAYKSLKNNLQYLYMFEKFSKLGLPQTNNSLEAINSHLKTKSSIHRWLSEERKHQFASYYLYIS